MPGARRQYTLDRSSQPALGGDPARAEEACGHADRQSRSAAVLAAGRAIDGEGAMAPEMISIVKREQ